MSKPELSNESLLAAQNEAARNTYDQKPVEDVQDNDQKPTEDIQSVDDIKRSAEIGDIKREIKEMGDNNSEEENNFGSRLKKNLKNVVTAPVTGIILGPATKTVETADGYLRKPNEGRENKGNGKKNLAVKIVSGVMAGVTAVTMGLYFGVDDFKKMVNGLFGGGLKPGEIPPEIPITSVMPSATPSSEASASGQVTLTPGSEASEDVVSPEMQEKFALAPEIDGLYKDIQEKDGIEKVVYLYESDNPYGGVEDQYAGEFKKDVFTMIDGDEGSSKREVGGLVMTPRVVRELVKQTSEELGNAVMPIPIDISILGLEDVVISFENILGDYPYALDNVVQKVEVENNAVVDMICVSFEKDSTYRLLNNDYYGFEIENSYAGSSEWADKRKDDSNISEEEWSSFLSFMGDIDTGYYNDGVGSEVNYGDVIGKISSPVYMSMAYMSGMEPVSLHLFGYKTGDERFYIPVFITANR